MKYYNNSIQLKKYFFEKDYQNTFCVDCHSTIPDYCSINNGVFLCKNCAEKHIKLGYNFSYIHALKDKWDPYLISYMERGGNSRFFNYFQLKSINIESLEDSLEKYRYNVTNIYRLTLRSEVLADEPPDDIPIESYKKYADKNVIYFPEFNNYKICNFEYYDGKTSTDLINLFRYLSKSYVNIRDEKDTTIKIVSTAGVIIKTLFGLGKILYKECKPHLKYLSIKAIQGIGYACKTLSDKIDLNEGNNEKNKNIKYNKNSIDDSNFNCNEYDFVQNDNFPTFEEIICVQHPSLIFENTEQFGNNEYNGFNILTNQDIYNIINNNENIQNTFDTNNTINNNNNNIINNDNNNDNNNNIINNDNNDYNNNNDNNINNNNNIININNINNNNIIDNNKNIDSNNEIYDINKNQKEIEYNDINYENNNLINNENNNDNNEEKNNIIENKNEEK